jgi:hypothetical protein
MKNELVVQDIDPLFKRISDYIDKAKYKIQSSIDAEMVLAYWNIGKEIVQEEQQGADRAAYGKAVLKALSKRLQFHCRRGFSVDVLEKG